MAGVEEIEGNIHHCFTRSYLHQGGVEPYDTDILPTARGHADGQQQVDTSVQSSDIDISGMEDELQEHSAASVEETEGNIHHCFTRAYQQQGCVNHMTLIFYLQQEGRQMDSNKVIQAPIAQKGTYLAGKTPVRITVQLDLKWGSHSKVGLIQHSTQQCTHPNAEVRSGTL
jgi:hypothetical protein